ncbi:hypothetical protein T265_09267 [Opisthorchis viverrini]|uniref:Uncharacterized protein n=1 Tax=Opisthorchis viverrini TaxID=6198 RepID=A0A074Z6D7_OPIVI|nr:hypothetical protein T265_09267 [Opisthorchis viverrini]KER22706.1 hypothetical protein T265_09267 [Opisthorchis viverrini]
MLAPKRMRTFIKYAQDRWLTSETGASNECLHYYFPQVLFDPLLALVRSVRRHVKVVLNSTGIPTFYLDSSRDSPLRVTSTVGTKLIQPCGNSSVNSACPFCGRLPDRTHTNEYIMWPSLEESLDTGEHGTMEFLYTGTLEAKRHKQLKSDQNSIGLVNTEENSHGEYRSGESLLAPTDGNIGILDAYVRVYRDERKYASKLFLDVDACADEGLDSKEKGKLTPEWLLKE